MMVAAAARAHKRPDSAGEQADRPLARVPGRGRGRGPAPFLAEPSLTAKLAAGAAGHFVPSSRARHAAAAGASPPLEPILEAAAATVPE
jgi:hypothetical protein